jgi:hypothetical protein
MSHPEHVIVTAMPERARLLVTIVTLLVAASAGPAAADDRLVVLPATGANVHPGHLAAATDVLRSHLERTGRWAVGVASAPAGVAAEPTPAQAGEVARQANAALAVTLRVARLGATASVRLAAYRPDASLAHVDEIGASGPDDLDPAIRRLALGLAEGRTARALAELDSVTEREADPYLRFVATNVFGIRLGSVFVMNRASAPDSHLASGGGLFWLHDARSWLADLSFDVFGTEDDSLVALGLGAYYPFGRRNLAPYLGGGLSYAWVDTGGRDGGQGLQLRAAAGVLFGRLSTVQLRLEASWAVNAFEESPAPGAPAKVPHGPLFTVGLGY